MIKSSTAFGGGTSAFLGGAHHRSFSTAPAASKSASDKRFAPRRPHKLTAYVSSRTDDAAKTCYVRDSSSTGLMIEMRGLAASATDLGDRVKVYIPIENVEFECRVVWRAGSRAGLTFVKAARHFRRSVRSAASPGKTKPRSLIGRLFSRG